MPARAWLPVGSSLRNLCGALRLCGDLNRRGAEVKQRYAESAESAETALTLKE